jgi:hypothetical protein
VSWAWEYEPNETSSAVTILLPQRSLHRSRRRPKSWSVPPKRLDGTAYQGAGEGTRTATVANGFFLYLVIPRHQRVYLLQVTAY